MERRRFLTSASAVAVLAATSSSQAGQLLAEPTYCKLDAHIHLFDPTRKGGIPWPEPTDALLYKPALPSRYQAMARQYGICGAIAIEASPWASDNDWLLNVVTQSPFLVGMVGNLDPASPGFAADLERLVRTPLFLGIRYGNLWGRDLFTAQEKPEFIAGLKALASYGKVFESANPDLRLLQALNRISDKVPNLRIVADHLPNAKYTAMESSAYWLQVKELAAKPQVFAKISEIPVAHSGALVIDPGVYQERVAGLWESFGADRVLFGSDWPNSESTASFADTMRIVAMVACKLSPQAQQQYYALNSRQAYRWQLRTAEQRTLLQ